MPLGDRRGTPCAHRVLLADRPRGPSDHRVGSSAQVEPKSVARQSLRPAASCERSSSAAFCARPAQPAWLPRAAHATAAANRSLDARLRGNHDGRTPCDHALLPHRRQAASGGGAHRRFGGDWPGWSTSSCSTGDSAFRANHDGRGTVSSHPRLARTDARRLRRSLWPARPSGGRPSSKPARSARVWSRLAGDDNR
jgi:hypothetical protein